ncbi:hypothetical protein HK096_003554, partial [Nowakowskiella sp. JEL0078]
MTRKRKQSLLGQYVMDAEDFSDDELFIPKSPGNIFGNGEINSFDQKHEPLPTLTIETRQRSRTTTATVAHENSFEQSPGDSLE